MTNRYTVLSPGLHYLENGEWRETVTAFGPIPGGWVARHGPHQVTLAEDLHVAGAVEVTSAEGTRLRGTPLQLFLYDRQADRSVVLGELQSSHGEQVEPNVILYRDAFTTFPADVRVERSRV